jgi:hypothetical protein
MQKRAISTFLLVMFLMLFVSGCMTNIHTVGKGGSNSETVIDRQWYVLWGLVPINAVNTKTMAGGSSNYTIKTEQSPIDVVINCVAGFVTVSCRSVSVTK